MACSPRRSIVKKRRDNACDAVLTKSVVIIVGWSLLAKICQAETLRCSKQNAESVVHLRWKQKKTELLNSPLVFDDAGQKIILSV